MQSNTTPEQYAAKQKKRTVDAFLHELGLLMLAETPIKSAVRNRTQSLRGEIISSVKPEHREMYLASRDVLLGVARSLATMETPEQLSAFLGQLQQANNGQPVQA